MARFALWATIKVAPGGMDRFLHLVGKNQQSALDKEPGCHRFIVLRNQEQEDVLHFYEEYDDAEAFAAHQRTEHYQEYFTQVKDMILERDLKRCQVV